MCPPGVTMPLWRCSALTQVSLRRQGSGWRGGGTCLFRLVPLLTEAFNQSIECTGKVAADPRLRPFIRAAV